VHRRAQRKGSPVTLAIGSRVPRRGNAISRGFGRMALQLMGWRHAGALPDEPKLVLLGAPHTTNFDGVIAILSLMALGLDARTMIKKAAFRGPLGRFLAWAGAVPIDRTQARGVIEQSVELMANQRQMLLLIAPEGTRGAASEWKRGFYYIALGAQVPIVAAACNYRTRLITFGPPVFPSGDYAADLERILRYVHEHGYPRHPERLSRPLCELGGRVWQSGPRED
jgi:1-acyl-sn-glycerol-3-phosphate acyltransferase